MQIWIKAAHAYGVRTAYAILASVKISYVFIRKMRIDASYIFSIKWITPLSPQNYKIFLNERSSRCMFFNIFSKKVAFGIFLVFKLGRRKEFCRG